jgi:cytochrome c-type biogenesis protein CcmH/NrfG
MSVQTPLGAARRAWNMLWDTGKTNDKEKEKLKASKKTTRRRRKRDKQNTHPIQINKHK